ncbi:dihydrolipoamide acetyltransferase family protein [Streptomyces chromofuscus]|uniref:Dihydrolipoamide acetyltransferase component of pyruvate dehydrogenase complex n=1 Tax=Streptomyces chromofuscus TaxID=42881 RepID=A0A7M2TAG8_STRCW|nr:dihydrolipoamide acetyltransferase family protein [Streptomyces chromofuscus]QOV44718.1 2-oxo acid dehydrogenase subunit E2 [Streptomyces chromofuscus]GGT00838.1 acetyltransferase component of pyruvate dehydrogenase complex [Streptomyces chromofuscus]
MSEFTMPSLGADMDEGTLLEWLVRPGDLVHKGDPVAVVETAKSTIEVECFETGTMRKLLIEPGATVPVGTPLALIGPAEERRPARHAPKKGKPAEPAEPAEIPKPPERPSPQPQPVAVPVSAPSAARLPDHMEAGPLVRHLAEQSGVDLETLHGTGPGGRVTRTDVEHAAAARATTEPPRLRATPLARRLAAELGVDLATVKGTGSRSAIRASDVRRAAPGPSALTPPAAAAPVRPSPAGAPATHPSEGRAAAMRQAIAGLMSRANRDIPHYYLCTTVDMAAATDWLHEHNRRSPVGERLLPAALLLKAAALAARKVPELNGFWTDDHFTQGEGVHLGMAVSLRGGGLVAPALHDADTLALPQLMAALKDLVTRARTGRLRGSEVSDATITVTNLGDQGVETVFGVIHPPQVALVGFGRVVDRPCAVDGLLGVRPVVTATLSADHRATNGAVGARYLTEVARLLQNPEQL